MTPSSLKGLERPGPALAPINLWSWWPRLFFGFLVLFGNTALADGIFMTNMQTRLTPASVSALTASSHAPGAQDGDIVEFVLKATVGSASATGGPGVYFTSYLPVGVEVLGAWFVSDATGATVKNPGQGGRANDGWGARGSKTPFGNPFSGVLNGRENDVYGDTGIFYSTDARTRLFTADGSNIALGPTGNPLSTGGVSNGYNVTDTFFKEVGAFNLWDANQVNAFGAGGALNSVPVNTAPTSSATVINSVGQGVPPFGSGSMLAGPDTGYTKDNTGSVGPWQRILYPGSQKADASDGPATAVGTTDTPDVLDASGLGSSLSDAAPLPAATNAVRWSYGYAAVNDVVYVKVRVRLNSSVLTASDGVILNFESNGSDNHGSGSKDNPWRYFGPTVSQAANLHVRQEIDRVNGAAYHGGNIPAGATVTYRVRYTSLSSVPMNSIALSATLPTLIATTGCTVSSPTLANPSNGVSIMSVSAGTSACPAAGASVVFGNLPKVSAGKLAGLRGGEFTFDVKLSATASNGASVSSSSAFSATDPVTNGAVSASGNATGTIGAVPQADLAIQQFGPALALLGDTVRYDVAVANLGTSSVSGATINDLVPANLTGVTWTCSGHGGAECGAGVTNSSGSGNSLNITTGALPVNSTAMPPTSGAYLTLTISGTAASAGDISNTATVSAPGGYTDPLPNNGSNVITTILASVPPPTTQTELTTMCGIVWPGTAPAAGTRSAVITPLAGPDVTVTTTGSQGSGYPTYSSAPSGIIFERRRDAGAGPLASTGVSFASPSNAFILAVSDVGLGEDQQVFALDNAGALMTPVVISTDNGAIWDEASLTLHGVGPTSGPGQGGMYLYYPAPVKTISVTDIGAAGNVIIQLGSYCDYGDAPESYGTIVSSGGSGGPVHQMPLAGGTSGGGLHDLYLGYTIFGKLNGYPSVGANTDPQDDGVSSFPFLTAADTTYRVQVRLANNLSEPATVVAWIDFNIDGQFQTSEQTSINIPANSGAQEYTMTWTGLSGLRIGQSYARFRLMPASSLSGATTTSKAGKTGAKARGATLNRARASARGRQPQISLLAVGADPVTPTGWVPGGEVEDYALQIAPPINLSGRVWHDADGSANGTFDGINTGLETGTGAGGTFAVLTDAAGNALQSVPVAADGAFSFAGLPANTDVRLLISSAPGTAGQPAPSAALPAGWVGTSPLVTPTFSTGTSSISGKDFGVERPPTATGGTAPTQPNPSGTSSATVPSGLLAGLDPDGRVVTYTISGFPAGADGLSVNGTPYTASSFPAAGVTLSANPDGSFPAGALAVDPQDGSITVSLPFTVTDNAGKTSAPATAGLPFAPVNLGGTVWNDGNGNQARDGSEPVTDAGGLNAVLTDGAGTVLAVVPVDSSGAYSFAAVTPNAEVRVLVTTDAPALGGASTAPVLPADWFGTTPGTLGFNTGSSSSGGHDFGLERLPQTDGKTAPNRFNPTGAVLFQVPGLSGWDPEDGGLGAGGAFTIVSLPVEGSLSYAGGPITAGQTLTNYDPALLQVDPDDATTSLSFLVAALDAAGQPDPSPARVTMGFTPIAPPVAANDRAQTLAQAPVIIPVLENDHADLNATLEPSSLDLDPGAPGQQTGFTDPKGLFELITGGPDAGRVRFTPNPGVNTDTASIPYTVLDSFGQVSNPATITVEVGSPAANPDSGITAFDTPISLDVIANDRTLAGRTLEPASVDLEPGTPYTPSDPTTAEASKSVPGEGVFARNPDGTVTFTPDPGFFGTVAIPYTISDDSPNTSSPAEITVIVNPPTPQAVNDSATTPVGRPVAIEPLVNDVGPGINPASLSVPASGAGAPSLGVVTLAPDGTVTYTPNPGVSGMDTFTYTVCNTAVPAPACANATVTVTVTPEAVDDGASTPQNTPVTFPVAANDRGTIDPSSLDLEPVSPSLETTKSIAGQGTFTTNPDGSATFAPVAGFSGPVTPIPYTVNDTSGQTASPATLRVTVAPQAVNDSASTPFNTPVIFAVTANDLGQIDPSSLDLEPGAPGAQTTKAIAGQGTFTANPDGSATFMPVSGFSGLVTPIPYTIQDASGQTSTAMLEVRVTPVAVDDSSSTPAGTPLTFAVAANDLGLIDPAGLDLEPGTPNLETTKTVAGQGAFSANPDGTVTFAPEVGFSGPVTPIPYTVRDTSGLESSPANLRVNVTPKALDDAATTTVNTPVTFAVSSDDLGSIVPSSIDLEPGTSGVQDARAVAEGSFQANPDGTVTFTPTPGFSGPVPAVPYAIEDASGQVATANLNVTVTPKAVDDSASTPAGTPVTFAVSSNDLGSIDPSSLDLEPGTGGIQNARAVTEGAFSANPDGTVTFTPTAGFSGVVPAVPYTVRDASGQTSSVAHLNVTVTPKAMDDTASTPAGTPVTFAVAANDLGLIDPATLDLEPSAPGAQTTGAISGQGGFSANPDGTVTFAPDAGFSGPVTPMPYTVNDTSHQTSSPAMLKVTVTPRATDDTASTLVDQPVTTGVLGNDLGSLAPGTLAVSSNPAHGSLTLNPDATITYTPATNFSGLDSYAYTVCDSSGQCTSATVNVTVGVIATDDTSSTPVNTPVVTPVLANDHGNLDPASVTLTANPIHGAAAVNPDGTITYTPTAGYSGPDTYTYRVCDAVLSSVCDPATVTITVTPKAVDDGVSTPAGTPVTFAVAANDLGQIDPASLDLEPTSPSLEQTLTVSGQGAFSANPDGSATFTPEPGFSGPVNPVPYAIRDASGQVANAVIRVIVTPKAVDDSASTYTNNPVTIAVLPNDQGQLEPASLDLEPGAPGVQASATTPHGAVALEPDQTVKYTPNTGFDGNDSFPYQVCDRSGQCTTANVTVIVSPNQPPVAVDRTEPKIASNTTLGLAPLVATDADGTIASLTISSLPTSAMGTLHLGDPASGGAPVTVAQVLTPAQASSLFFKPNPSFSGNASFTFTATDDKGAVDATPATVTIPVNAAPETEHDTVSTPLDTSVTIRVLENDLDLDGTIDPSTVDLEPGTPGLETTRIVPDKGTFTANPDGTVRFTPVAGFTGQVTIPYRVNDNEGARSNVSNITVIVEAGRITGRVFSDVDGNGLQNSGEANLAGLSVTITPAGRPSFTVTTDANGTYGALVQPGPVTADVSDPTDTRLTTANDPQTVTVASGSSAEATAVGFQPLVGNLSGRVFMDVNGNRQQDANESGLEGVQVNVTARDGAVFNLTTHANGTFRVARLTSGPATVDVVDPDGLVLTTANDPQTLTVPAGSSVTATPVGFVKPGLSVQLTALQQEVTIGGTLEYQIRVTNTSPVPLRQVEVVDELPAGLAYRAGSSRAGETRLEPQVTLEAGRQVLTWALPGELAANADASIRFATTVTPNAKGTLENRVKARANAGTLSAPVQTSVEVSAVASVKITLGTFTDKTALVGRVYFDRDHDRNFDPTRDEPLAGARVYLSDGRYAVTDAQGRYSLSDLEPGAHVLRLDPLTAPYRAESVPEDQGRPGSRVLHAQGGLLTADFPLEAPDGEVLKVRSTTVTRGPVMLEKRLVPTQEHGYAVRVTIKLDAAVADLRLTDPLPAGAARGQLTLVKDGQAIMVKLEPDGTILAPGTLEAGTYELDYTLQTDLPADLVVTDPSIQYTEVVR